MNTSTWISGALVLAAGLAGGWALRGSLATGGEPSGGEVSPALEPASMAVAVTTEEVRRGDFPVLVAALGRVKAAPTASIALTSRAGGRVVEVPVVPGQQVKKDDVVVRFDKTPADAALAQARAELARAEAALDAFDRGGRDTERRRLEVDVERTRTAAELASAQLERLRPLQRDGLVAARTVEEARLELAQRELERDAAAQALAAYRDSGAELERRRLAAELAAARARVADAEAVRAEVEVIAPASGTVTELSVRPGESVDPQRALARLLVADGRRVQFDVSPVDASRLSVGARARWHGMGGAARSGAIDAIGATVDELTGLVKVFVRPDGEEPPAEPGRAVRGDLEAGRLTGALLVPERAIIRADDQQAVVIVDEDDLAHVVTVAVRARHEGVAAVEGGLNAGDRVVVDGAFNLPEGAHVVPVPHDSSVGGSGR